MSANAENLDNSTTNEAMSILGKAVKTAYNHVGFNNQESIILTMWVPSKKEEINSNTNPSDDSNQANKSSSNDEDGPGLLCLLHNNRIFAFYRKNKPNQQNMILSSVEQNLVLNMLTQPKYRIANGIYFLLTVSQNVSLLLVIILSVMRKTITTPSPTDLALFIVSALEKFYDIMSEINKFWFLQRISIYIALILYIAYAYIAFWMVKYGALNPDSTSSTDLQVDSKAITILILCRFVLFIVGVLMDIFIDGELHNDLLKLQNKKANQEQNPEDRDSNELREEEQRQNSGQLINSTQQLLEEVKDLDENHLNNSRLIQLFKEHVKIQAEIVKLCFNDRMAQTRNEKIPLVPPPTSTTTSAKVMVQAIHSVQINDSSPPAQAVPTKTQTHCKIKSKIRQIWKMVNNLDKDFKMPPDVKYMGSFFAWGINSVYGVPKIVWRGDPLRTCCSFSSCRSGSCCCKEDIGPSITTNTQQSNNEETNTNPNRQQTQNSSDKSHNAVNSANQKDCYRRGRDGCFTISCWSIVCFIRWLLTVLLLIPTGIILICASLIVFVLACFLIIITTGYLLRIYLFKRILCRCFYSNKDKNICEQYELYIKELREKFEGTLKELLQI